MSNEEQQAENQIDQQYEEREASRRARQGYIVIARVDTVHSEEAETIDDPPGKAQFLLAEGKCLELLYVGRDYALLMGKEEDDLRLKIPEDEGRARKEMEFRAQMQGTNTAGSKGNQ